MLQRTLGMLFVLLLLATGPLCALEKNAPLDIPNHSFEQALADGSIEGWGIWNYFNRSNKARDFTIKLVEGGKVGRSALRSTAETGNYYGYKNSVVLLGNLTGQSQQVTLGPTLGTLGLGGDVEATVQGNEDVALKTLDPGRYGTPLASQEYVFLRLK